MSWDDFLSCLDMEIELERQETERRRMSREAWVKECAKEQAIRDLNRSRRSLLWRLRWRELQSRLPGLSIHAFRRIMYRLSPLHWP